jgi:hypothetical protein
VPLADLNSRNGFAPIPGVIHRPTRTSLPPIQGCARKPVGWVPTVAPNGVMGTSGLTHREDFRRMDDGQRYVAVVKLNTARGIVATPAAPVPAPADVPMTTERPRA